MKVYNYHPVTGEYLGESVADPSPLEPGKFLIPKHATFIAPPAFDPEQNQTRVFDGSEWKTVVDRRGVTYFTPDGDEVTITGLGVDVPEDALNEPPDLRTIEQIRSEAIERVNEFHARMLRELNGVPSIEEQSTWPLKVAAAQAIRDGEALAHEEALIDTEASLTGETREELVAKIISKDLTFQKIVPLASGLRRKTISAIRLSDDSSSVEALIATAEAEAERMIAQL